MKSKINLKIYSSLFVFFIALFYAIYTDHRWEDWYITYKVSKNLALGNGLVYHAGEYIMTFTSPFGVLIPALIKWLFINKSDDYVIWIFRILNIFLLSFVPVFLIEILKKLNVNKYLIYFSILLVAFNSLIIDNSINGMEAAFMVFFISYLLWILIINPKNLVFHLALSLACIMYSRPDGFIYAGSVLAGFLILNEKICDQTRTQFVKTLFKSSAIALILYLPWFFWTWWYYETPVPHTVIAKSVSKSYELIPLIKGFIAYNVRMLIFQSSGLGSLFMPAYSWAFGTWGTHFRLDYISHFIGIIVSFYWLYPKGNIYGRTLSLAVYLAHFYLARISGQGTMPWYMPSLILPSILAFSIISFDFIKKCRDKIVIQKITYSFLFLFVLYNVFIFFFGTIQMKAHQEIVEFGNRKQIGLWLRNNSNHDDRIYMECLGYIGFYSGLKTLDYPGMSSPEVVAARKVLNESVGDFPKLVYVLKPEWLILRPGEYGITRNINPEQFEKLYQLEKKFDVSEKVRAANLPFGEAYLLHDAIFYVLRLKDTM